MTISKPYAIFVHTLCRALASGDAQSVEADLPNYQYNTGLRYGTLSGGEGRSGDSSLLGDWLSGTHPRCVALTPDRAGHGTVLAGVWSGAPGSWSLIEMDTFEREWKINDLTFGSKTELAAAMRNAGPVEAYGE